jgi:hypothetical protein
MPENTTKRPELKLLIIIIERKNLGKLEDFIREKNIRIHYMIRAMGTARSEVLKSLGLSGSEKTICICVTGAGEAEKLCTSAADRFSLTKRGNGIICIIPVSGISAVVMELLKSNNDERTEPFMENLPKENKDKAEYSLVISVINQGYSETLMSAARSAGASGGTIIHARHSGIEESVKFFGVSIQAEKEIVAIVIPSDQKTEFLHTISHKCGLKTEAHGIIISIPVENCIGIDMGSQNLPDQQK